MWFILFISIKVIDKKENKRKKEKKKFKYFKKCNIKEYYNKKEF